MLSITDGYDDISLYFGIKNMVDLGRLAQRTMFMTPVEFFLVLSFQLLIKFEL